MSLYFVYKCMVEILCPHCEEEIELDDDAQGEFSCPHCDGEFEWGMDEVAAPEAPEATEFEEFEDIAAFSRNDVLQEYSDNPALRITVGVIFAIWLGIHAIGSIFIIFSGMLVDGIENAVDSGTSAGSFFILIGLAMLVFYSMGVFFGIKMAMGRLHGLIGSTIIAGLSLGIVIIGWLTDDVDECLSWETDPNWGPEMCSEWGPAPFPIAALILWLMVASGLCTMIFIPKVKAIFY